MGFNLFENPHNYFNFRLLWNEYHHNLKIIVDNPIVGGVTLSLKTWFTETRPNFLLLTPICFSVGLGVAFSEGYFNLFRTILGLIGAMLAHISVNVLNDYFDFRSGLDLKTKRTPFSGGSGILPSGLLHPKGVYFLGITSLFIDIFIGIYFILTSGWFLLPLLVTAGVIIYFYTPYLARWYIGEVSAGLGFGPLMVLGSYYIQTGTYSIEALSASIVPGILVLVLLFLNEFPDAEVDKEVGRKNLVIRWGRKRSASIYILLIAITYLSIIFNILLKFMPWTTLIALITLPVAFKAGKGALNHFDEVDNLIPTLASNVLVVLATTGLTALGFFLAPFIL